MRARNRRTKRARWHRRCFRQPFPCTTTVSVAVRYVGFELKDEMMDEPHASKQLYQASVSKRKTDHQIGSSQAPCPHVDQAQDEGGQGEGGQAQGRGVGDATVLD